MKENQIVIKMKGDAYRVCVGIKDNKGKIDAVPLYNFGDKKQAQEKARALQDG